MEEESKTREQLLSEIAVLRQRVSDLEKSKLDDFELYRTVFEISPESIGIYGLDGKLLYANTTGSKMFGYETLEDVVGADITEFVIPEQRRRKLEQFKLVVDNDIVLREEYIGLRKDGTTFNGDELIALVKDTSGKPKFIIGSMRDITELKRSEQEIRKSGEQIRSLIQSAPEAIFVQSSGRFVYVNPAMLRLLGASNPDELLGHEFMERIAPEFRDAVRERIQFQRDTGQPAPLMEQEYLRLDGSRVAVETTAVAMRFEGQEAHLVFVRDITERQRAENTLRASERKFRAAFMTGLDAVYLATLEEGRLVEVNDEFEALFGYPREQVIGRTSVELGLYDDPSVRTAIVSELKTKGWIKNFETRARKSNGEIMIVSLSISLLPFNGRPYILGVVRDITESKLSEDRLRASEEKFYRAFQFNPSLMAIRSLKDDKFIDVNEACVDTLGYKREELIGTDSVTLGIVDHRVIEILREQIKKQGFIHNWEGEFKTKTGDIHTGLISAASIQMGDEKLVISAIQDITERKRMEEELSVEHARLVSILDGIPVPSVVIDRNRNVILWNTSCEIQLGKTKAEMLGKRLDLSFLYRGKPIRALAEMIFDATDDEIVQQFGSKGVRKSDAFPGAIERVGSIWRWDGERTVFMQAARIFSSRGEIIGAIQTVQDITETVRVQKEREKMIAQLTQSQKMEAIGTLAGGIAHDFNNILSSLIGYTELAMAAPRKEEKRRDLEQVLKACNRAKDLVNQILTFSRRTDQERKPIEVGSIAKEALKLLRSSLPTTIKIRQKITPERTTILADPTQIHQLLMNLCTNAAHAMHDEGGVLEVHIDTVEISAETLPSIHHLIPGPYVKLTVSDTGHGIDHTIKERIFEPFFTTKELGEGTGLGLSVVYGIVKSCDGAIDVESGPGKGTTFTVYLPRIATDVAREAVSSETIPRGRGRVLFVDDDDSIVTLGERILRSLGYEVTASASSTEALKLFLRQPDKFDLVITDMTMPDMTGVKLAKKILETRKEIPIILCTGFSDLINEQKAKTLGIRAFLMKPFSKREIAVIVKDVLKSVEQGLET